jgi:hypothetical protein
MAACALLKAINLRYACQNPPCFKKALQPADRERADPDNHNRIIDIDNRIAGIARQSCLKASRFLRPANSENQPALETGRSWWRVVPHSPWPSRSIDSVRPAPRALPRERGPPGSIYIAEKPKDFRGGACPSAGGLILHADRDFWDSGGCCRRSAYFCVASAGPGVRYGELQAT